MYQSAHSHASTSVLFALEKDGRHEESLNSRNLAVVLHAKDNGTLTLMRSLKERKAQQKKNQRRTLQRDCLPRLKHFAIKILSPLLSVLFYYYYIILSFVRLVKH